ncbi:heme-binding protein [Phycicoccus sp.]|uniref:GlcG/HbpS family heme-binding protein n=1 Tax=Phycicoccus sp. TaxID=1902410 RepID=UPI002D1FADAA|nr:heme-binding protein [Phycicoccus sp.]
MVVPPGAGKGAGNGIRRLQLHAKERRKKDPELCRAHPSRPRPHPGGCAGRARRGPGTCEELQGRFHVAVTDAAGDLLAFARMDDAFAESGLIAIDKCRNVVRFRGAPTDGLYEALAGEDAVVRGIANRPGIAAFGGGVAIVVDGHVVGAVGASGGSAAALGAFAEQLTCDANAVLDA